MPPITPFCTESQVSYLLHNTFFGGAPSSATVPPEHVIGGLITWTDGVISSTFASAGYAIPFAVLSGETWPVHQTTLIEWMSMVGTAAMISGYILTPIPGRGNRPTAMNAYGEMFDKMKSDVIDKGLGFRAQYYLGSKAERWLTEPYGPRMDFLEDYIDPTRYLFLKDYTNMILDEYDVVGNWSLNWDYLYDLRAATAN